MSTDLFLNGINGSTGKYLFHNTPEEISRVARGEKLDEKQAEKLEKVNTRSTQGSLGPKEGVNPSRLDETGWGVIFAHDVDPAIRDALGPLLEHRQQQAAYRKEKYYQEYTEDKAYRLGESTQEFLARHGASGVDAADPENMPYYLLIVGDPESIPYHVQYELDVQYAVGRIHFDTPQEYAQYAESVIKAEKEHSFLPRRATFFGVNNPDDRATELSAGHLVQPLVKELPQELSKLLKEQPQWVLDTLLEEQASKAQLAQLLNGEQPPALLFTASHGMGFDLGDPRQLRHQGALLCQDWPGPWNWDKPISEDHYFSADDVSENARLLGTMAFFFACYGAGTPRMDHFALQAYQKPEPIAPRSFVAPLPQKLLSHPKGGALAVIGHVERAWTYSFLWADSGEQTGTFKDTLKRLLRGYPIGAAMEYFNARHGALSVRLIQMLNNIKFGNTKITDTDVAGIWTANNDTGGYVIIGDPAVRLRVTEETSSERLRPVIEPVMITSQQTRRETLGPSEEPTRESSPKPEPSAESPETLLSEPSSETPATSESQEAEDFGISESLDRTKAKITSVLQKFSNKLVEAVQDVSSLDIQTFVSDDMDGVTYDFKTGTFTGSAKCRAWTHFDLDADTKSCVPKKKEGEIDEELLKIHTEMVKQARAHQTELIKMLFSLREMLK